MQFNLLIGIYDYKLQLNIKNKDLKMENSEYFKNNQLVVINEVPEEEIVEDILLQKQLNAVENNTGNEFEIL